MTRLMRCLVWAAVVLVPGAQPARLAYAFHTVFHFTVDRVEVDGNAYGPFDGTPDVVDEFDDADMAPWRTFFGTVYQRDGLLHLTNPGVHYNILAPLDLSDAVGMAELRAGLGSFRVQSVWTTTDIPPNNLVHMSLWSSPDTIPGVRSSAST